MTHLWSVQFGASGSDPLGPFTGYAHLEAELLEQDAGMVIVRGEPGRCLIEFTVENESAAGALMHALAILNRAAGRTLLPRWPLTHIEIAQAEE